MKRAIVLGGGGSRGGYQIGVWEALRELEIDYQIVTGCSVGALNGAMMAQGDYEAARRMWENLTTGDVIDTQVDVAAAEAGAERLSFAKFLVESLKKGGADFSPLAETVAQVVDEQKCRESGVDFGLVTVKYPSMKPLLLWKEDIPEGKLQDYMLASAACFPAFRVQKIDGEQFVDGSYYDVMPVNMALARGADEVIAVNLEGIGISRKTHREKQRVITIGSHRDLGNFLIFDGERAKRLMRLGYLDTMRKFGRYEGFGYTFELGESVKNTLAMENTADECMAVLLPKTVKMSAVMLSAFKRIVELLRDHGSGITVKRLMTDRETAVHRCIPMLAEICGELFGADELAIYRFRAFNTAIYRKYGEEKQAMPAVGAAELLSDRSRLSEEIGRLRKMGGRAAVYFLKGALESALKTGAGAELWLAASLLPKEFCAAAYLCLLDRTAAFVTEETDVPEM